MSNENDRLCRLEVEFARLEGKVDTMQADLKAALADFRKDMVGFQKDMADRDARLADREKANTRWLIAFGLALLAAMVALLGFHGTYLSSLIQSQ